jgi:hypothetical protein
VDRRRFIASAVAAGTALPGAAAALSKVTNGYLRFDNDAPGLKPKAFAKDILGRDHTYPGYQTFSEAGDEFYYAVTDEEWQSSRIRHISANAPDRIETLRFVNDKWEGEPCIVPDGGRLFFTAIMPPDDQPWHADLYCADRTPSGWGPAKLLSAPVISAASEWHGSVTNSGVLYFASERDGGRLRADVFRAVPEKGSYRSVEKLPDIVNSPYNDCDPLIAPDESYLIVHPNLVTQWKNVLLEGAPGFTAPTTRWAVDSQLPFVEPGALARRIRCVPCLTDC